MLSMVKPSGSMSVDDENVRYSMKDFRFEISFIEKMVSFPTEYEENFFHKNDMISDTQDAFLKHTVKQRAADAVELGMKYLKEELIKKTLSDEITAIEEKMVHGSENNSADSKKHFFGNLMSIFNNEDTKEIVELNRKRKKLQNFINPYTSDLFGYDTAPRHEGYCSGALFDYETAWDAYFNKWNNDLILSEGIPATDGFPVSEESRNFLFNLKKVGEQSGALDKTVWNDKNRETELHNLIDNSMGQEQRYNKMSSILQSGGEILGLLNVLNEQMYDWNDDAVHTQTEFLKKTRKRYVKETGYRDDLYTTNWKHQPLSFTEDTKTFISDLKIAVMKGEALCIATPSDDAVIIYNTHLKHHFIT